MRDEDPYQGPLPAIAYDIREQMEEAILLVEKMKNEMESINSTLSLISSTLVVIALGVGALALKAFDVF